MRMIVIVLVFMLVLPLMLVFVLIPCSHVHALLSCRKDVVLVFEKAPSSEASSGVWNDVFSDVEHLGAERGANELSCSCSCWC